MKLTIVTHHLPNHQELADITSASKRRYAERHGYRFHEQIGEYSELGFDFQRIQIIRDLFFNSENPPDTIWWLGCDTMVMNHVKPVHEFLADGKSLHIHKDVNGLNNDSFLIRRTDWTRRFLDFTLEKAPEYAGDCWQSQRIWQHYVETDAWKDGLHILPHPGINSYFYDHYRWPTTTPGHFNRGDLLLHLPGMRLDERLAIFRSARVQNDIVE